MGEVEGQQSVMVQFVTRSRTILHRVGARFADIVRPSVAVAWRTNPEGEWQTMQSCPVPDDPAKSAWALVSGRWADTPLSEIPA